MYIIKVKEELAWGLVYAITVYILEILVRFDPNTVTDWRAWGVALFAGVVRAGAAVLLVTLGKGAVERPSGG